MLFRSPQFSPVALCMYGRDKGELMDKGKDKHVDENSGYSDTRDSRKSLWAEPCPLLSVCWLQLPVSRER